jgi:glycosyltransferase involved in cell wall biosynthesis
VSAVQPYLSIVVPLYNEEENIRLLVERIQSVCVRLPFETEVILVDDGSTDATADIGRTLTLSYPNLKMLVFRRNFGQTPAMVAGLQAARGEILLTMDGDLQNDPEDIPAFISKIEEGYALVIGWRANRQDKLVSRKIPSRIANWLIGKVTGVAVKDNGCSLKAYRASVIKAIPLYSEMHRFIPAMASIAGANFYELEVRHHARQFGKSKYGINRVFKVAVDLIGIKAILTAARYPSVFFAVPSVLLSVAAVGFLLASLWVDSLVFFSVALLLAASGLTLLLLGVLAELLMSTGEISSSELATLTETRTGRFFR